MDERAPTRRRYYYSINEVQLLERCAAQLLRNSLAAASYALRLLSSAPELLRFSYVFLCYALGQLRLFHIAVLMTQRRSTQRDEHYNARTWRDFAGQVDFRKAYFRFSPDHIPRLIAAMELPAEMHASGYSFSADEAITVLLYMLSQNASLVAVNERFGIKRARASAIFRHTVQWLHDRWYKPLLVTDFRRWQQFFPEWAAATLRKQGGGQDDGTAYTGIVAFTDGTLEPTCRPTGWMERQFYSGYKKRHGLHWQACLAPMGLLLDLAGPFEGRHTDLWMMRVSELCERLQASVEWAVQALGKPLAWMTGMWFFFGDAGYNRRLQLAVMFAKPPGGELTDEQTAVNHMLSKTRIANEWIFNTIDSLFPYVADKRNALVGRGTAGTTYVVAALLTNALTCLEGSATSKYFGLTPPTLEEYFAGAPAAQHCPAAWYENLEKYQDLVDV